MLETVSRQRWIDITFGLTDGWWRFIDADLRPDYPLLGQQGWHEFLAAAGFRNVITIPGEERRDELGIERVIIATVPEASTVARADAAGRWLIVGEDVAAAEALASRLDARGGQATVAPGTQVAEHVAAFAGGGGPLRGVVHLAGPRTGAGQPATVGDAEAAGR